MKVSTAALDLPGAVTRAASALLVAMVLFGIVSHGVLPRSDPYRCHQLLYDGNWLDPAKDMDSKVPAFLNWQPKGCKLRQYTKEDIHRCMEHRHMVFSGDSTVRQVFWAMARLVRYMYTRDYLDATDLA